MIRMIEEHISIGKASQKLGVTIDTLRKWEAKGLLIPQRTPSGHRRYSITQIEKLMNESGTSFPNNKVVIYARVSTQKQMKSGNLARQIERLTDYAMKKGYEIVGIHKDVASGLNENRKGLLQTLKDIHEQKAGIVLIEFKDRLARFGYQYLSQYIQDFGGQVEVMEQSEEKDEQQELVEDLIAITTSFSARIYGKCGGRKVALRIEQALKEGEYE